jgi:hypothetical protein
MKQTFLIFILILSSSKIYSQTIISNSIYADTTWTLVGSPYIVVNNIVVYPGVTLTIEPGVTIKFNGNLWMEIRESTLIAVGTLTDSITFTSNYSSPASGSWSRIYADTSSVFNYCNFNYAVTAVNGSMHVKNSTFMNNETGVYNCVVDSCVFKNNYIGSDNSNVNNSTFLYNQIGIFAQGIFNNCIIDSNQTGVDIHIGELYDCEIKYNQHGVTIGETGSIINCLVDSNYLSGIYVQHEFDSIVDCEITNNGGAGIDANSLGGIYTLYITGCVIENNDIGVIIHSSSDSLYCNQICNNNFYDLEYAGAINYSLPGNYWCTTDSATLSSHIHDGYDNGFNGLVSFYPIDTTGCNFQFNVSVEEEDVSLFSIYPNPTHSSFTIQNLQIKESALLQIFNLTGQNVFQSQLDKSEWTREVITNLQPGIYFVYIDNSNGSYCRKLVIE